MDLKCLQVSKDNFQYVCFIVCQLVEHVPLSAGTSGIGRPAYTVIYLLPY